MFLFRFYSEFGETLWDVKDLNLAFMKTERMSEAFLVSSSFSYFLNEYIYDVNDWSAASLFVRVPLILTLCAFTSLSTRTLVCVPVFLRMLANVCEFPLQSC